MARDRQQAKRRQAERRAARLRERGADGAPASAGPPRDPASADRPTGDGGAVPAGPVRDVEPGDPAAEARIAAAAPPQTAGRSDTVVEAPPPAPELEPGDEQAALRERAPEAGERRHGRVVSFLIAVWAELQRVQWPDRKTLTTLTGVVLGFVLVAGAYLGGLDAIISRLMQAIL